MKQPVSLGVTLTELMVASTIMGLLFFSGLQLLVVFNNVYSRIAVSSRIPVSIESQRLEMVVRALVQDAEDINVSGNGRVFTFTRKTDGTEESLTFKYDPACRQWSLFHSDSKLAQWTKQDYSKNKYSFKRDGNLLTVTLNNAKSPLLVWLRNSHE